MKFLLLPMQVLTLRDAKISKGGRGGIRRIRSNFYLIRVGMSYAGLCPNNGSAKLCRI